MNGLAKIVASEAPLPYPSWMGQLPMPYCRQNAGQNRLRWQTPAVRFAAKDPRHSHLAGKLDERADVAGFATFLLPAAMGYISQPAGQFSLKVNGKPALAFDVTLTDQTWQSGDGTVRMSYTVMENNSEDSNGVIVIEVAPNLIEPGKPVEFEVTGAPANSQRWFGVYLLPK
jgi:hypothetical protein